MMFDGPVLPEIVKTDANGWLSIDYVEIVPILIEAFKEHMKTYHETQASLRREFEAFKLQLQDRARSSILRKAEGELQQEPNQDEKKDKNQLGALLNTRPLAQLDLRSKSDVKELAHRMSTLVPRRPYNQLMHTIRADARKKKLEQKSYALTFVALGIFLVVANAILAAAIPIYLNRQGAGGGSGIGVLIYPYCT